MLLGLLLACAPDRPPPPAPKVDPQAAWASALLRSVGDDGTVDYTALAQEPALARFIGWVGDHGPETDRYRNSDDNRRLAWSINAVNAHMLWAEVKGFSPGPTEAAPFPRATVLLDSEVISLERFVRTYLAPLYEEPMAVAALACGVRSCPPLSPRLYTRAGLDAALDRRMRLWAASGELVREEDGTFVFSPALRPWMHSFEVFEGLTTPCAVVGPFAPEPLGSALVSGACPYRWDTWDGRRREGTVNPTHAPEPAAPEVPEAPEEAEPDQ